MPAVVDVVAAVVERGGRYLITRRLEGTHLAGLWEFPGGKTLPGESPEDAKLKAAINFLKGQQLRGTYALGMHAQIWNFLPPQSADARAAIRWLCAAFGFVERCCIPEDGPFVRHAQL